MPHNVIDELTETPTTSLASTDSGNDCQRNRPVALNGTKVAITLSPKLIRLHLQ